MRSKTATDRTMNLTVEYQSTDQKYQVRFLKGNTSTRELSAAIKTSRLGRAQADKLSAVQVRWLEIVREMLTNPPKQEQDHAQP